MSNAMHRVSWQTSAGQPTTWLVSDGLLRLNRAARDALAASAVVLANDHAMLIQPEGNIPLRVDSPLVIAGSELVWSRDRANLAPLPFAATNTTSDDHSQNELRFDLVVEDQRHPLSRERREDMLLVGRHRCCHIQLNDERVSAVHCAVVAEAGGVRIVDLDSRNGTFVDATRCRVAVVTRRAVIEVGRTRLLVEPREAGADELVRLPSTAMAQVYDTVARVAPADAPIILTGESGTGKEGVAHSLHTLSGRRGRFIALNAAALTPNLAGSELFGHVRGAFTGAESDRQGAFVAADGGTLFLDEVADLQPDVQAELLRVLEAKRVRPVGATTSIPVDVRLVTATNRDLTVQVQRGAFRADLFHRIWVLPITLPLLHQRLDDLDVLCDDFLARQRPPRHLSATARERLHGHRWPGNIRELLNVLRRACVMTDAPILAPEDLIFPVPSRRPTCLDEMIRSNVLEAVQRNGGSVIAAARELGIHRSTVHRHIKVHNEQSAA